MRWGGCFPMQERRPCDGDHTQHPSGTAEQDTLRTWVFQLTQLAQWEGRRWNGKVERSAETVLFNTGFTTSANGSGGQQLQCSGKPVCGESIMWNHHESNQKIGQRVQKLKQVHQVDQTWLPRCKVALLGAVPCICCAPLPV